jgi:ribosome biogenesis ATPase
MSLRALHTDVYAIVQRFLDQGVKADPTSLYDALSKSNSALKRRPKKVLISVFGEVLDSIKSQNPDEEDSEAEIEAKIPAADPIADLMNRSLRSNLAGPPTPASSMGRPVSTMTMDDQQRSANGESMPKRLKRTTNEKISVAAPEGMSLGDIGGMDDVLAQLEELVVLPLQTSEVYTELKLPLPKGVLLYGPPGCGKTMIARALAAELGKPFIEILGPTVVSSMSGDSEKAIRERFDEAKKHAPCIIFIDEIDAIAPARDSSQSQMEKRMVAQLLVCMDELTKDPLKPVVVIAATNRPDSLDPALRRGGRFGSEINIGVPNERVRMKILERQIRNIPRVGEIDLAQLAKLTAGFVGADLHDLVGKAGTHCVRQYRNALKQQAIDFNLDIGDTTGMDPGVISIKRYIARSNIPQLPRPPGFATLGVSMTDFLSVLPSITPSSKREGFATVPSVSWSDVGALTKVREDLTKAIINPIQNPETFSAMGLDASSGVLLWGPPGCGKTLIAQAAAAESKANFISIKGPELLNKFVGESEAAVRKVFLRARSSVPCVIFIDELDALVPKRDGAGSEASARIVNTFLTELDGIGSREGIYVIGATNRLDVVDGAMLRPGRLGQHLFVGLPGAEERADIFRAIVRKKPCEVTAAVEELVKGERCEGYSGADLAALVREGGMHAIGLGKRVIEIEDLKFAATVVKCSVPDPSIYRERSARGARSLSGY